MDPSYSRMTMISFNFNHIPKEKEHIWIGLTRDLVRTTRCALPPSRVSFKLRYSALRSIATLFISSYCCNTSGSYPFTARNTRAAAAPWLSFPVKRESSAEIDFSASVVAHRIWAWMSSWEDRHLIKFLFIEFQDKQHTEIEREWNPPR